MEALCEMCYVKELGDRYEVVPSVSERLRMYVWFVCVCVCVCASVCVRKCVWREKETGRERQGERQRE